MNNIFCTIRRAIQKDAHLIQIEPSARIHEVVAYLNLRVKKPFSIMSLRDYFAEQIISLCIRTGEWSVSSLRFRVSRIEVRGRCYRLHLVLASKWKTEDAYRLDAFIANLHADLNCHEITSQKEQQPSRWCDYVIGACIHDEDAHPQLFGNPKYFTYFYNVNFVPFIGKIANDEWELLPAFANLTASDDEVSADFESHNALLGEVPELSTIASILSATSERDGNVENDIDELIASADDAFSEFSDFAEPIQLLATA